MLRSSPARAMWHSRVERVRGGHRLPPARDQGLLRFARVQLKCAPQLVDLLRCGGRRAREFRLRLARRREALTFGILSVAAVLFMVRAAGPREQFLVRLCLIRPSVSLRCVSPALVAVLARPNFGGADQRSSE